MKNLGLLLPTVQHRNLSVWATVTDDSPLRIRLDGDAAELPFTPDDLVGGLSIGQRVWVSLVINADPAFHGRRAIIVGTEGGVQDTLASLAALVTDLQSYLPISAVKTGNTARTAASATADPHLSITIPAGQTHDIGAELYLSAAANGEGDFLCNLGWTGTAVVNVGIGGLHISLPSGSQADYEGAASTLVSTSPSGSMVAGASTAKTLATLKGHIVTTTSCVLTVNWGLFTAVGTTTLLERSSLWSRRRL